MPKADPMPDTLVEIETHGSLAGIGEAAWDACACPEAAEGGCAEDPFTTFRFLAALEESGSVGPGTGWEPHYLAARHEDEIVGVAPLYAKSHSQGEYVFDHNWAHAYENAGGRYYPKLQIAVPFTPVTGRRLLARPGHEAEARAALLQGAVEIARRHRLSSLHATFCTAGEAQAGEALGLLHRTSQQFHWTNPGYADFAGFLATLSSRKRKNIRKERETARAFGGEIVRLTGADLRPEHWDAFWRFYQDTGSRKWGRPYLTREFFDRIHATMADDLLLVLALRNGHPIAGALNFLGRSALYGRYWGCTEDHPCLHFELCYYQAIDHAIETGLSRVEAGAQGEHKLSRGLLPHATYSQHWLRDPDFAAAVANFLHREGRHMDLYSRTLAEHSPFRREL